MKIFVWLLPLLFVQSAIADWKPVEGKMLTRWGAKLEASSVWAEYPRPQLVRKSWLNLNGLWSYAITQKDAVAPATWPGEILIPFCPESSLSGVGKLIEPDQSLWYQRELPTKPAAGERTLLHFEAVDYETTVWVNGKEVGRHVGGHTPFSFDITKALKVSGNRMVVRVYDATEGWQIRGKQSLNPHGITSTRVSGIWQTVWLEQVPERFIEDLDYGTEFKNAEVSSESSESVVMLRVNTKLSGQPLKGEFVRITVSLGGKVVASAQGGQVIQMEISAPMLWSPDSPTLYDVRAELLDENRKIVDTVTSYTALRQIGKIIDTRGNPRFALNGKEIFLLGPLEQGWWPDGLLTPPSDEAMLSDLKFVKAAGFNMVRKHVKVEPARYYYHCDRLGIAVWQDQVNAGMWVENPPVGCSPKWIATNPNPTDGNWPDDAHQQWVLEYKAMVDHLRDHPSILVWCPFNESWGQHRSMEIGRMAKDYDPSRLVCIASGGNFWPVGDIASQHHYPNPQFPIDDPRFQDYIKVVGEMGGYGWPIEGHLLNPEIKSWGYNMPNSLEEWKDCYRRSMEEMMPLREFAVSAAIYTQASDFDNEVNGLQTFDRVPKVDAVWLKVINERVINGREKMDSLKSEVR